MAAPNSFGGYSEANMFAQPNMFVNGLNPQIYTAVYSNVSVFEMEVNGIAVMRRRADSWLNATQILKVAGVDKGKRTKVLEKEITGEHEKVQGGYGKYQGTWVNYQRGREFCRQYGVEQLLLPLLEYDISSDGLPGASQGIETPTKEQAMAAQRKRMYGGDGRQSGQSAGGTFFKNMSSTAANAIHALNRTRLDSPNLDGRRSAGPRRQSQTFTYGQDPMYASQQSMPSMTTQDSFGTNGGILSQGASFADFPTTDAQEPPRKRIRPSPQSSFLYDGAVDLSMQDGTPTDANISFFSQPSQTFVASDPLTYGIEPLPHPSGPLEDQKKELLLDLFIDPERTDFDDHPAFLRLSGDEFEMPIDGSCNTALHWAATLARIALVRKLLDKGFNLRRANSGGETALIAACQARNNLDRSSFPALLELLGPTIEVRDGRGRTLLHHVAVSSAMKGRASVGKYYLESLLEFVIRQGASAQATMSFDAMNGVSSQGQPSPMTLARFMSDIVNAQDKAGDTALNLAARTSTTAIIEQLIEVGADPNIANRGGLAPVDFGVRGQPIGGITDPSMSNLFEQIPIANGSPQKSFEDAQEGIMTCKSYSPIGEPNLLTATIAIRDVLSQSEADFAMEIKERKETLDKTNAALKESGNSLAEERRRLDDARARVREKGELEQKIINLRQATSKLRTELGSLDSPAPIQKNVAVGEADKGLDLDGQLALIAQLIHEGEIDPGNIAVNQDQANLLGSLERAEVMCGRAKVYQRHNQQLEQTARTLKARSAELEERYKKIVSLCTGADEEKVDELLDNLVQAVISEQKEMSSNSQLPRVREFLRLVQGSGN